MLIISMKISLAQVSKRKRGDTSSDLLVKALKKCDEDSTSVNQAILQVRSGYGFI